MSTPFASLEARMNASVLRRLANVQVVIGGATVPGIFKTPSARAALGVGMEDTRPTVDVASSAVPLAAEDSVIDVGGAPYTINEAHPDGTGLTRLVLGRTQ